MNILSVTNALKEIKLKELDDEFQIVIVSLLNNCLPDSVSISRDSSGDDIRLIIDSGLDPIVRSQLLSIEFISDQTTVVRFYNNVEKVQQYRVREVEYDDAIKGNFFSTGSFFIIVIVLLLAGIYASTENTRGKIPESRILTVFDHAVQSLAKLQGKEVPTEPTPPEVVTPPTETE